MKQHQFKLLAVDGRDDLEVLLNKEGESGWSFKTAIGTPFGMKFLLERELNEEVKQTAQIDELAKKFGV